MGIVRSPLAHVLLPSCSACCRQHTHGQENIRYLAKKNVVPLFGGCNLSAGRLGKLVCAVGHVMLSCRLGAAGRHTIPAHERTTTRFVSPYIGRSGVSGQGPRAKPATLSRETPNNPSKARQQTVYPIRPTSTLSGSGRCRSGTENDAHLRTTRIK